jgi:hypothetical protein
VKGAGAVTICRLVSLDVWSSASGSKRAQVRLYHVPLSRLDPACLALRERDGPA